MTHEKELSKYYEGNRPEIVKFLPPTYSKVLEIGCGDASFRNNLNENCEYWGVEPAKLSTQMDSNTVHRILAGYFDDVYDDLPDGYFDLVICNDVIEHVPDHDSFFCKIKLKMTSDGTIIGSIPNVRYFDNLLNLLRNKDWEYQDSGILDRTHLRFFTEKSLLNVFKKNGFVVEEYSGVNNFLTKTRSIKKLLKYYYLIFVLSFFVVKNSDIRYQQFAFRIRVDSCLRENLSR